MAILAFAAVFVGWAGWSWISASNDDSLEYASARDEVLRAGRQHVIELTTLDHDNVDKGIARWLASSTGALRDELASTDAKTKKSLREAKTVANGKVLDAAVTELDLDAGTATMLASVEITVSEQGSEPTSQRNRFTVQLARTDGGWKLSALDQVPVGNS
ncbi:MAG: hypothetical protein GEU98_16165 [Pseudonocardiaceae bacterium]|nr:hypothetical protein [Pseudonocardiaceae bacterium]